MSARLSASRFPACDLAHEHGVLLRQWAGAQQRISDMAAAHARRCAALETELMRQRARWVIATTRLLWGLGWPGLTPLPGPTRKAASPRGGMPPLRSVQDVLCQTGCASHGHAWLDEASGDCRLNGQPCARQKSADRNGQDAEQSMSREQEAPARISSSIHSNMS